MLDKNSRKKIIYWVILGCAIFMRIVAFFDSDNFHGIAMGKIIAAYSLLAHPGRLIAWIVPAHGPLHLYLVAISLKLSGNAYASACVLSLLFGVGICIAYFHMVRIYFNEKTAICSMFLLAFFPLHIVYSVLSTAETAFLFFLFSGLFFFLKYKNSNKDKDLIFSALILGLASMCRFEGGLFIIIVTVLLVQQRKKALIFLLVASLMPVVWMWCNYLLSGNFLEFLLASDNIVKTEFRFQRSLGMNLGFFARISYWPLIFKSYFGLPVFLIACWGFIEHGFKRQYREIVCIFLSVLVFFSYKTLFEELAMQPRYGMSLGLLFLPFFSIKFLEILKLLRKRSVVVLLVFIIYVVFRCAFLQVSMMPRTPYWINQTASFLKENVGSDQTVYIETEEDNLKAPLKIYSDLNLEQFIDYNPFSQEVELLNVNGLKHLRFIVLISRRELKNLKEMFRVNNCKIYEVKNYEK